jgi:hypothetical protein
MRYTRSQARAQAAEEAQASLLQVAEKALPLRTWPRTVPNIHGPTWR